VAKALTQIEALTELVILVDETVGSSLDGLANQSNEEGELDALAGEHGM
jgi:hypothetical protein